MTDKQLAILLESLRVQLETVEAQIDAQLKEFERAEEVRLLRETSIREVLRWEETGEPYHPPRFGDPGWHLFGALVLPVGVEKTREEFEMSNLLALKPLNDLIDTLQEQIDSLRGEEEASE